jgi:preprotein translocase subunit SecB
VTENTQAQDVVFTLEKIYLRDVSFEAPGAPQVFMEKDAPEVHVQLGVNHRSVNPEQALFEVVLTVGATAKREQKNYFLVEVQQAGVFRISGVQGEALARALEVGCAHVLLPFAREAVNELVTKGGFPQLLINPINFDALFEQKQSAQQQPAAGNA